MMRMAIMLLWCAGLGLPRAVSAQTSDPTNPHGVLPADFDCAACHSPAGWTPIRSDPDFNHDRMTRFALTGGHQEAACVGCHLQARFDKPRVAATDCASCHVDVHLGNLGASCAECHSTNGFADVAGVAVHARTSFPLTGAHSLVPCEACHGDDRDGAFTARDAECVSCHEADYQAAQSLDHEALAISTACQDCHVTMAWGHAGPFDHMSEGVGFALLGAHATAPCTGCHVVPGLALVFPGATQDDCVSCHQADYDAEHGGGFPTECILCHGEQAWTPATFDHATAGFALLGAHAAVPCASCHVVPGYTLIVANSGQDDCVGCHQADYDAEHGGGFPTECVTCHGVDAWQGATVDHATVSAGFTLLGAHATLLCTTCHVVPGYALTVPPTGQDDCVGCHQADYDAEHGGGFPTECVTCHGVDAWQGATVDHATVSAGFTLLGAHTALPCTSCHVVPGYALTVPPTGQDDCVGCHQADYDTQHGGGFPTECVTCHGVDTWQGATFDHTTVAAGFLLVGAHASLPCTSCHVVPGYALTVPPTGQDDCVGCHQADYDTQHGGGFPTECVTCHGVDTWQGAAFDHTTASAGFTLIGAHASIPCTSCHVVPGYALTVPPTGQDDCITCHQADYDAQHGGSGFSTDCITCHTVDGWPGAGVDHDAQFFPIYSGRHLGTWGNDCSNCHDVAGDFRQVTCLQCHQHSQTRMDSAHSGRRNYSYTTAACLSCHPDGRT